MNYRNTVLEKIVLAKKEEVAHHQRQRALADLQSQIRASVNTKPFAACFQKPTSSFRLIAEIKKASPSGGLLQQNFNPVALAQAYAQGGAVALSVLTDGPFFQGSLFDLQQVQKNSVLPVLRKDFLFDPYQVYEARAFGADCILLIVAMLEKSQLEDLSFLAQELALDVLVEIHDAEELEIVFTSKTFVPLLGINHRNLKTLKTDLSISHQLLPQIPKTQAVIAESGLSHRTQLAELTQLGVCGFLIGESILRAQDPVHKLKELTA